MPDVDSDARRRRQRVSRIALQEIEVNLNGLPRHGRRGLVRAHICNRIADNPFEAFPAKAIGKCDSRKCKKQQDWKYDLHGKPAYFLFHAIPATASPRIPANIPMTPKVCAVVARLPAASTAAATLCTFCLIS